jgi:hypothetical protein
MDTVSRLHANVNGSDRRVARRPPAERLGMELAQMPRSDALSSQIVNAWGVSWAMGSDVARRASADPSLRSACTRERLEADTMIEPKR